MCGSLFSNIWIDWLIAQCAHIQAICIISRKQKACSCAPSTTRAACAAGGVWRVTKGALRTHCAKQAPLWGGLRVVICGVLFARAPVSELCFYDWVKNPSARPGLPRVNLG